MINNPFKKSKIEVQNFFYDIFKNLTDSNNVVKFHNFSIFKFKTNIVLIDFEFQSHSFPPTDLFNIISYHLE